MWSSRRKSWNTMPMRRRMRRAAILAQRRGVLIEHRDQAAGRPQRQKQHPQQRGLAGARWPGEELERMASMRKLRSRRISGTEPVAQADILEPDHAVLRKTHAARVSAVRRPPNSPSANLTSATARLPDRLGFQSVNGLAARFAANAAAIRFANADRLSILRDILRRRGGNLAA